MTAARARVPIASESELAARMCASGAMMRPAMSFWDFMTRSLVPMWRPLADGLKLGTADDYVRYLAQVYREAGVEVLPRYRPKQDGRTWWPTDVEWHRVYAWIESKSGRALA